MPFAAFEMITAAKLNRIQPTKQAATGTSLSVTTTETDIPGATVTMSSSAANAKWVVWGNFDVITTTAGASVLGRCNVDGTTVSGAPVVLNGAANQREEMSWTWNGTLASAGSHTFKLRGDRDVSSGTQSINAAKITVEITEVV